MDRARGGVLVDLSFLNDAVKVGGGAVGGGAVSAFFGYLTSRSRVPSIAQDAVNRAVKTALDSTTREIDRLNGEVEKLKTAHRQEMEQCRKEQESLRAEIERLMKLYQPLDYKARDLRRLKTKTNDS